MFKVVTKEGAELYIIKKRPHHLQYENKKHVLNVARQPHHLRTKDTNVYEAKKTSICKRRPLPLYLLPVTYRIACQDLSPYVQLKDLQMPLDVASGITHADRVHNIDPLVLILCGYRTQDWLSHRGFQQYLSKTVGKSIHLL